MGENHLHRKMTTDELIGHMKSKGICFAGCSEVDAAKYLRTKNDYFRVSSFRKLFPKYQDGRNAGRYINLDFDDLRQLSYVDQSLRALLRIMSLDVEHYQKVAILDRITEAAEEDGYSIIRDYRLSLSNDRLRYLNGEIANRKSDVYCGAIIDKYENDMPAWAFFEVVSFGTFIDFCRFSANRWDDKELRDIHYMLKKAKSIRNAASHGACIINGFVEDDGNKNATPYLVQRALGDTGISKSKRSRWLRNPRMREITTLVYLFSVLVEGGESKAKVESEINEFLNLASVRMSALPSNNPAVAGVDFIKSLTEEFKLR